MMPVVAHFSNNMGSLRQVDGWPNTSGFIRMILANDRLLI